MNRLFILGLVIFLTACYSREIPTTRGLLERAAKNFAKSTHLAKIKCTYPACD